MAKKNSRFLVRWTDALSHMSHLRDATAAYDAPGLSSLQLWLESWRLGRLAKHFRSTWGCKTREDVLKVDADVAEATQQGMRPLEVRRWRRGQQLLRHGLPDDLDKVDSFRPSSPALSTWLTAFDLSPFVDGLLGMGAVDVRDLLALGKFTLEAPGFEGRDLRQWKRVVDAVGSHATTPWLGPGGNMMADTLPLQGWLERYRPARLHAPLEELGAAAPVDLLGLSVSEVSGLGLR